MMEMMEMMEMMGMNTLQPANGHNGQLTLTKPYRPVLTCVQGRLHHPSIPPIPIPNPQFNSPSSPIYHSHYYSTLL